MTFNDRKQNINNQSSYDHNHANVQYQMMNRYNISPLN